jgi:N-acetylglutamate synthase-like GNAT family acetyltransferase
MDQTASNYGAIVARFATTAILHWELFLGTGSDFESSLYLHQPFSIFMTMTETSYVTRRATFDDLPQLMALWRLERLPAEVLEKRFTEFQVVTDETGQVLAAVGVQIAGTQGWLHNESIAKPELSDVLRERLWNRLQVIIKNHALERLWLQNNSPYWRTRGFERANAEQLKLRPAAFFSSQLEWQVVTLRAADANAALEHQLAEVKALQQQETAVIQRRIKLMKQIALGVTVVVFLLVVAWAVVLLKFGPKLFPGR